MRKIFTLFSFVLLLSGCHSQNNSAIVTEFMTSFNERDSINVFNLLDEDFIQTFELIDTVIQSKKLYVNNYSWGKVMEDHETIEIISTTDSTVEVFSNYYCLRDSILNLGPYQSIKTFYLKDGIITRIEERKTENWKEYTSPRGEAYNAFFIWLEENHALNNAYFPFDRVGALRLKEMLFSYKKTMQ